MHAIPLVVTLAATAGAATLPPVPAPISSVTVYSDRARVTRTAEVTLSGSMRVSLPLLLDNVDPSTIAVEAAGAVVDRVDIARVAAQDFPRQQARELLAKLEQLDDELAHARGDRAAAEALLAALARLQPEAATQDALRPVPRLNPANWAQVAEFVDGLGDRLQARMRALDEKLIDLEHERARLGAEAQLLGGAARRGGYRITPTLSGQGGARVVVSYMVANARWYPSYDLQLLPDQGRVLLSFAGQVSQETGEDWQDARLTLSTAVPATSTRLPKLFTWKIGEQERFIPTPVAATTNAPATSQPTLGARAPAVAEVADEKLRNALVAYATKSDSTGKNQEAAGGADTPTVVDGVVVDGVAADEARLGTLLRKTEALKQESRRERSRVTVISESAPGVVTATAAPPAAAESTLELDISEKRTYQLTSRAPPPVTVDVGLAPPPAWQAPTYAPELPVSLAGGYDLIFPARRAETVKSGAGARRVALLSESWPVDAERRVYPALAAEAFLVAVIKNPSAQVLPGGPANLFVGADPAGTAALKVMAPGEMVTLPLGVDRALKTTRNVKLSTWEKGVFSKDEVTQYDVTMEVANPYRTPLRVGLTDQWPTTSDKNVEVKLLRADGAQQDHQHATLRWSLTVPPSAKSVVSFTYSVRRPKGWRLHQ